jgi:hypothetical protein
MHIQHAIWKVGDNPQPLVASQLVSEQKLEDMIVRDPRILSSEWMLIGRQPIPPLAEQSRIVAKVDELMALCDQLKIRITSASQLQQKLADVMVEQVVA